MTTKIENKEKGKKKGFQTIEEFEKKWKEQMERKTNFREYNWVFLEGKGNYIYADNYLVAGKDEIFLYFKGNKIATIKLSLIKYIV